MRPTDVCHPIDTACTRTSCDPSSLTRDPTFAVLRGDTLALLRRAESWAPSGAGHSPKTVTDWGKEWFTPLQPLRRIDPDNHRLASPLLRCRQRRPLQKSGSPVAVVGVVFPRCSVLDRASDTPVASLSSAESGWPSPPFAFTSPRPVSRDGWALRR